MFVDQFSPDAEGSNISQIQEIRKMDKSDGTIHYYVKWKGVRTPTWEPESMVLHYGGEQHIKRFIDKPSTRARANHIMLAAVIKRLELEKEVYDELEQEARKAVQEFLLKKKDVKHDKETLLQAYMKEFEAVLTKRMDEVVGHERERVLNTHRVVRLRMNYEPKRDARCKFRCIVMGHTEPREWSEGGTDSPVASTESVRILVFSGNQDQEEVLAACDIDTAFLQGMEYGPGDKPRYVAIKMYKGAPLRVYKLRGSLYGQREASMRWYKTLAPFLVKELGYTQGDNDLCSFIHEKTRHRVVIHVDDLLTRGTLEHSQQFFKLLQRRFNIKPPRYLSHEEPIDFCGIRIRSREQNGNVWYSMDQEEEITKFLEETQELQGIVPVATPMPNKQAITVDSAKLNQEKHKRYRSLVGSMQYFATQTRYDIAHPLARLAQYCEQPTEAAYQGLLRVAAYLKGTADRVLEAPLVHMEECTWDMYVDSDWAGDRALGTLSHTGMV